MSHMALDQTIEPYGDSFIGDIAHLWACLQDS
jgi:hypothetical protein